MVFGAMFGVTSGTHLSGLRVPLWGHFGITSGSRLGPLWGNFGTTFGTFLDYFGVDSGSLRGHSGIFLGWVGSGGFGLGCVGRAGLGWV